MLNAILNIFGYKIVYIYNSKEYESRYDSLDYQAGRPIHEDMSTAHPYAITKIVKKTNHANSAI